MPLFGKGDGAGKSTGFFRKAMSFLLLAVMIIVVLVTSGQGTCGPSITDVDIEQETSASAKAKFNKLKDEYKEYSEHWRYMQRLDTQILLEKLAKKAGIDYDPATLPLKPPTGGVGK
jgi:hypothetical protein